MPHTWNTLITFLSDITRENCESLILCRNCGNRDSFVKYGHYKRYLFNDKEMSSIQRYRCDNDLCSRKTFSVLPHAFLPILRASLCMFMHVLKMYAQGLRIAQIARITGSNWPKTRRWINMASKINQWLQQEGEVSDWGSCPCLSVHKFWSLFTRDFSWAFYPDRF